MFLRASIENQEPSILVPGTNVSVNKYTISRISNKSIILLVSRKLVKLSPNVFIEQPRWSINTYHKGATRIQIWM